MKQTVKTSRTAGYLEKMFRAVNERYFGGELEEPIITIQSTPRAYGHVTVAKTWTKGTDGELRRELNLGSGTLARDILDVTTTLIHECCHLKNLQAGIQDCSRGGTYHNKRFRDTALSCDLNVDYNPRIGWAITSPTERLLEFVVEQGWTDILMNREEGYMVRTPGTGEKGIVTPPTTTRKPSSTRKYICPCCGQSVRATKTVNIICGDCLETMVPAK